MSEEIRKMVKDEIILELRERLIVECNSCGCRVVGNAKEPQSDHVRCVAEETHLLAKELYEKLTRRRAQEFPTEPTTRMLLEHTNTMLTLILDKV